MAEDLDLEQHIKKVSEEIDLRTRERIHTPIVTSLYDEFTSSGSATELARLVSLLPIEQYPLVLHSLSTHVTREKASWVTQFASQLGIDTPDTAYLGAVSELLWTAALIADDIEDDDTQRANAQTVWVRYGKEDAFKTWNTILDILQIDMNQKYPSLHAGDLMRDRVNIGLQSLVEHRKLSFDSSMSDVEANYYKRAMFHANLPFEILFPIPEQSAVRNLAIQAIQLINNAGQILNDLKDLVPGTLAGRAKFGDIRNGVITVPLKLLYDQLPYIDQQQLTTFMGTDLSEDDSQELTALLQLTHTPEEVVQLALQQYQEALNLLEQILPTEKLDLLRMWITYKTEQATTLMTMNVQGQQES